MLAESDLERWLGTVEAGKPACVFADDVEDARDTLEQLVTSELETARVVALSWGEVPPLGNELGLLVNALAEAVLTLFPSLYGAAQLPRDQWSEADIETETYAISRRVPGVLGSACRRILRACRKGEVPKVSELSHSEQVRQLGLAIEPRRLVVLIAVLNRAVDPVGLRALAQGAEWLASNTRSRVILALPSGLEVAPELDHVTYTACVFAQATVVSSATPTGAERAEDEPKPRPKGFGTITAARVSVSPAVGRPHPASDAEKELHRRLTNDPELCSLFAYNQRVSLQSYDSSEAPPHEIRPIVDLVWEAGRFVVEIDGDDHRRPLTFAQDRKRDFALLMSGYRVARFTNSRVIEQPRTVVEQIRAAVRYLSR